MYSYVFLHRLETLERRIYYMAEQLVKMSLRLSQTEKEAISQYAADHDLSMSQVIRKAIKEFLNKESME